MWRKWDSICLCIKKKSTQKVVPCGNIVLFNQHLNIIIYFFLQYVTHTVQSTMPIGGLCMSLYYMKKLILVFLNLTAFITLTMKGQVECIALWEAVCDAVLWLHTAHLVKCSGILMQNIVRWYHGNPNKPSF